MKREVHQKIEETLHSLDHLQRAEANPFLWSKIKNRLAHVNEVLPLQLAWRMIAALIVVIIVNVFTLFNAGNTGNKKESGSALVANEYSLTLPQSY